MRRLLVGVALVACAPSETSSAARSSQALTLVRELSVGPPFALGAADGMQDQPAVAWGTSGWLVAWRSAPRNQAATIMAARVAPDGGVRDPAGLIVRPSSTGLGADRPAVGVMPNGNFAVLWSDDRVGGKDVWAAEVTAMGTVTAPVKVRSTPGPQGNPAIAFNGTDTLLAWSNLSDGFLTLVRADGGRVSQDNVANVAPPSVFWSGARWLVYGRGTIRAFDTDLMQTASQTPDGGAPTRISFARGDDAGMFAAEYAGGIFASLRLGDGSLGPPGLISPTGVTPAAMYTPGIGFSSVWLDPGPTLRWATIDTSGLLPTAASSMPLLANSNLDDPLAVADGPASSLLVFKSLDDDIYARLFEADGGGRLVHVSRAAPLQVDCDVASDRVDSVALAWEQWGADHADIHAAVLTPTLTLSDVTVASAAGHLSPAVAFGPQGALVAYEDESGTLDVFSRLLDRTGALGPARNLSAALDSSNGAQVAWGPGTFLTVWADRRNGTSDVYGALVDATGANQAAFAIATGATAQSLPFVAADDAGFLVEWMQGTTSREGAFVSAGGAVVPLTGPLSSSSEITAIEYDPSISAFLTLDVRPLADGGSSFFLERRPRGPGTPSSFELPECSVSCDLTIDGTSAVLNRITDAGYMVHRVVWLADGGLDLPVDGEIARADVNRSSLTVAAGHTYTCYQRRDPAAGHVNRVFLIEAALGPPDAGGGGAGGGAAGGSASGGGAAGGGACGGGTGGGAAGGDAGAAGPGGGTVALKTLGVECGCAGAPASAAHGLFALALLLALYGRVGTSKR